MGKSYLIFLKTVEFLEIMIIKAEAEFKKNSLLVIATKHICLTNLMEDVCFTTGVDVLICTVS